MPRTQQKYTTTSSEASKITDCNSIGVALTKFRLTTFSGQGWKTAHGEATQQNLGHGEEGRLCLVRPRLDIFGLLYVSIEEYSLEGRCV